MPKISKQNLLIFIFGLCIGALVLFLIKNYTVLNFDPRVTFQFNPFDLIALIVNILILIYISEIINKKNDNIKIKKEILIKKFDTYYNDYCNTIDQFIEANEFNTIKVKAKFKSLRSEISNLINLAIEYEFLLENDSLNKSINDSITENWTIFTDDQPSQDESTLLKVIQDIESNKFKLFKLLFALYSKINDK